ncbi:MAG: YgiT-type zinc finger protein [Candidatus Acidiferrales bacterium]
MDYICSNCGKPARKTRGNYLFRECGLNNIVLKDIEIMKCDSCGNEDPIIARITMVMRTIALALANKPFALCGEEIRYLRKYLGMSGDTFSSFLHTDKSVLSRWENNREPVGPKSDRLIRLVVLGLGAGLRQEVEQGVRRFTEIDESPKELMVGLDPKDLSYEYETMLR